ncbi:TetR/AcrR family transcriptional regulator [Pseudobacteriovorax antillogorgiicola]|uniref:Transcriptional regulator, TetR family n=1 Tax=Pseudobacteriovorax antillogorgiicola TaxID=1513793 RepID=A0A1Y6CMH0_9BACT|nr:TetR/AcrR family transcriptional regulator [Pseudobacteriovorax antillogorgiicola]TCS46948.1 TetR family transcriptional regulator [Pseudobacteriovorax antillogorgiicola]SMF64491.1 transcriptional regulator, TetR family [Pseudobacteriovorax antillogorgiicola]
MPRPRFHNLDQEKQSSILDVAEREFVAKGFAGASLNEIMREVGVSKGAIYYYFDDKADLFATCLERLMVPFEKLLHDIYISFNSQEAFWESLLDACTTIQKSHHKNPKRAAASRLEDLMKGESLLEERWRNQQGSEFAQWVSKLLSEAQSKGFMRMDLNHSLASRIWLDISHSFDHWIRETYDEGAMMLTDEQVEQLAHTQWDLLRRTLAP